MRKLRPWRLNDISRAVASEMELAGSGHVFLNQKASQCFLLHCEGVVQYQQLGEGSALGKLLLPTSPAIAHYI